VKLSVMQENLARGLSVVSRAVSSRSTLPVLANVLLRTEDAGLKLTATNLEIGITYWVPGKIDADGAITVPAKLLTDLVNSLPSGDRVELEVAPGDSLDLRAGRFQTHIKGIDADEFPAIGTAGDRPTTRIAQNVLRRALTETAFAAASDEARPILTGSPWPPPTTTGSRSRPSRSWTPSPTRAWSSRRVPSTSSCGCSATPTTRWTSSSPRRAIRSCSTSRGSTWSAA
jgi:DNA polymerase III sliding clamp (beta) subunit (PCNA family)